MAKEWTMPRSSEELHRRYKFKDIEATKKELDEYLNNLIFDDHLDATSTNPIQNRPVAIAMAGKVNTVTGKGLSSNDYTDYDKTKLDMMPTITQADVDRWNASSGEGWIPPIGYIWISTDSTNPGTLFDGTTWEQIAEGKVLLSAGSTYIAGNTGGNATHYHKTAIGFDTTNIYGWVDGNGNPAYGSEVKSSVGFAQTGALFNTGSIRLAYTDSASSLPPYFVAYMFRRTA